MIKAVSYWATDESKSESDKSTTESASTEPNKIPENTISPRINFIIEDDSVKAKTKRTLQSQSHPLTIKSVFTTPPVYGRMKSN